MGKRYNLKNIRTMLTEGFSAEELRRLAYDEPDFRPVYDKLAQDSGKTGIIDLLIEYSEQKLQIDNLLALTRQHNPARYKKHQPYYDVTPIATTSSGILEKFQRAFFAVYGFTKPQKIPGSLDEEILQILYIYNQVYPSDPETELAELIEITGSEQDEVMLNVQGLQKKGWLNYNPKYELVELTRDGLKPAADLVQPGTYIAYLKNPYIVGNPILPDNVKMFLGRFDIAEAITNEIKRGGQKPSILLYGRRRMGKTSALYNIGHLTRDPSILPVYISGQSVRFHTNTNFCYYLVREINKTLQQNFIDTSEFEQKGFLSKETFVQDPVLILSEFFELCHDLLASQDKYCLLSIDEYEEIDQHINTASGNFHASNITRELLLELRSTLQLKPRFIFLFAGMHYLRDLSAINWSEIFINLKTLHISFLERKDGYRLLTEPVPEMKYQNSVLIEEILNVTGCQPYLLQAVASALVNTLNAKDTKTVTQEILDDAIKKVLSSNSIYFDYIWDTECASIKHQKLLKVVSAKPSGISEKNLAIYQDELRDLIRREVLSKENGMVKFTMPIVKLWMEKNQHIL